MPFETWKSPENPLKNTLIFNQDFVWHFSCIFMAQLPWKMLEKYQKMPEKPLIEKSGYYQGVFKSPFCAPPFAILGGKLQATIAMHFLNASGLPRKAANGNHFWGLHLGFHPPKHIYLGIRKPRSNKRCFLNGVFQSGVFRGVVRIHKGRRHQNAWKHWCLQAFFIPPKRIASVASRGQTSEKHRLENTV